MDLTATDDTEDTTLPKFIKDNEVLIKEFKKMNEFGKI